MRFHITCTSPSDPILGVVQEEAAVDLEVNIGQKQAVDLDLQGHGHP